MTLLGPTSYFCLAVAAAACFVPLRRAYMLLVLTAPLTTVAFCNVADTSILVYQLVWAPVAVRTLAFRVRCGEPFSRLWVPFLIYALVSTFFALFNGGVMVTNVDSRYAAVAFSFQQYTQWSYLFMAVAAAGVTEYLLRMSVVSLHDVLRWLDVAFVIVLAVGMLQYFLPLESINQFIRNGYHVMYNYGGDRVSSTFNEPSMLSLYLVPMMGIYIVRFFNKGRLISGVLFCSGAILCLDNQSSSALVGLLVLAVLLLFMALRDQGGRISSMAVVLVSFASIALVVALPLGLGDKVASVVSAFWSKIEGDSVSGVIRANNIAVMWEAFLHSPVLGVGWGTARGESLLFTWLAEMGIAGFLLYVRPLGSLLHGLNRRGGGSMRFADRLPRCLVFHHGRRLQRALLPERLDCAWPGGACGFRLAGRLLCKGVAR